MEAGLLGDQWSELALLSPLTISPKSGFLIPRTSKETPYCLCPGLLVPFLYNVPELTAHQPVDRENAPTRP